jgi:hypothetical protein
MGLSKYMPSQLVYALAWEAFLLEDLMLKHLLPRTPEAKAVLRSRKRKQEEIWQDFYSTEAMITDTWKKENQELRHLVTRQCMASTPDCASTKSTTFQTAPVYVNCVADSVDDIIYKSVQKQ